MKKSNPPEDWSPWPKSYKSENPAIPLSWEWHNRKCPKCGAFAYSLWKIYGVSYFKCEHCGHRSRNL